ncbi:LysM peptidoglycan-binding domain-containing protein [Carnobacteriaceae bacterium zg-ZUI252]|nr:LysM peptidoglycan-binding domain-containing protein [Carnobacteriaceae bacterium zg-ZUI252]MBS4770573.1 LysM peptidoglycan-binding domain-containing protein [Carnobacteriaceae bacterium zg-ZUI240]
MFKRRKTQREYDRKMKNKMMATGGVMSASFAAMQIVSTVSPTVVHAQTKQDEFIDSIAPFAQQLAHENDLYASVMIAQAILESGWGESALSAKPNHNLFGVKGAFNGQSTTMNTAENTPDGTVYYIDAAFRKYPSYKESLQDYISVLKGTQFYRGAWKSNTSSYQDATAYLTGRYATAVNYNTVLNNIIAQYNLTRFDTPHTVTTLTTNSTQATQVSTPSTASKTYTVKSGDSVWGISMAHGISMDDLRAWNNIQNNLIHPGQVLKVSNGTTPQLAVTQPTTVVTPAPVVEDVAFRSATPAQVAKTYTVKSGDSVWGISMAHGISMDDLRVWNNIQNNLIHPGQVLKVSNGTTPTVAQSVTPTPVVETTATRSATSATQVAKTYTVKSGDSVWGISMAHGISMDDLRVWNNIQNNLIHPGQVLKVSNGTTPTVAQSVTPAPVVGDVAFRSATSAQVAKTYTVQSGDSVWGISMEYGISMDDLRVWNNIKNNLIHPGQVLKVSNGTTTTVSSTTSSTVTNENTYTVKSGDSVWGISMAHGISMDDLRTLNNIQNNLIHPGQVLKIK